MTIDTTGLLLQVMNGLALGVLYMLLASGLSVIFGITDILNFAHGALYTLGAYLAFTIIDATGSFIVALFLAPVGVAVIAAAIERSSLHYIYDRGPLYHVLLTFGLVLMITDAVQFVWGRGQQLISTPEILTGAVDFGVFLYPKYRVFTIVAGTAIMLGTIALFRYTRFGLIVRAGAQDQKAVQLMGINMSRYFTLVFAFGSFLAAIAGVLATPFLNVNPSMGESILLISFIVVVIGGLGSVVGSIIAALIIGMVETLGAVFFPQLSGFLVYLLMFGVLVVRPQGILGSYEIREQTAKISFDETIKPVELTDKRVLGAIGVFALLPLGTETLFSPFVISLVSLMFIWGLFALSLDIVMGYVGLISFGHAAFFGMGGYIAALTAVHVSNSFLLVVLIAILVSAVVAWIIGALSMRLAGVYFAMITFAAAQILYQLSLTIPSITGGSDGMGIPGIELLGLFQLSNGIALYYVALAVLVGAYYVAVRVLDSPFGRVLSAIRESERRASFLGYNTDKYKRRAFAISGAVGGLAGGLFVIHQTFVSPNSLYWVVSGDVLFAMIFGGTGTLFGPIVGGGVLVGLEHVLSSYIDEWRFVLGLLLVLTVMFAPRGLVSVYRGLRARIIGSIDREPEAETIMGDDA